MNAKMKSTQFAVIGGGPGGYAVAFLAADLISLSLSINGDSGSTYRL
jgi:pyruvate/2-oxoglutarate dehydrogenase complex dihydrolipoamide dehydrogenase (E3) component